MQSAGRRHDVAPRRARGTRQDPLRVAQIIVGDMAPLQFAKGQSEEDRERYTNVEDEARAKYAGLWQRKTPMPPWERRAVRRRQKSE